MWPIGILVLGSFLLYRPILELSLLSDDHSAIWWSGVQGEPWRHGFFRPLPDLLLHLSCLVHGPSPTFLRAFNILLHGFNAYLVLTLLHRSSAGRIPLAASFSAAAVFLFYPHHLESTIWIVGRESALGTAFVLLALNTLLSGPPTKARVLKIMVFFAAGLLCYESALLLPVLVIPFVLLVQRQWLTGTSMLAFGFLSVLAGYVLLRLWVLDGTGGAYFHSLLTEGGRDVLAHVPKVLARSIIPPHDDASVQSIRSFLVALIAVSGIILFIRRTRSDPFSRALGAAFFFALLLALVPAIIGGVSTRTTESGRFLHLPAAFLCSLVAVMLYRSLNGLALAVALLSLLAVEFMVLHQAQRNWIIASEITERILDQLPVATGNGSVYVVGLPGEEEGAYIFRNGFHDALRSTGVDPERFIAVSPMLRDSLRTAPDTLVPMVTADRISLWPDVSVMRSENGIRTLAAGKDTFPLDRNDMVVFWDRQRIEKLW